MQQQPTQQEQQPLQQSTATAVSAQQGEGEVHTLSGSKPGPRIVVKNTFIELESGASPSGDLPRVLPPRNNTWGAGLNALGANLLEDDEDEDEEEPQAAPAKTLTPSPVCELRPAKQNSPPLRPAPGGLHCVPEHNRLNGAGRQVSECSEASAASGDAPGEKRYQDTPLDGGNKGFSPISSASNLSTLDELPEVDQAGEEEKELTRAEARETRGTTSPNSKLQQDFGISVKNTFLEIEGEKEVASLRMVQTAAGNLYSMGGLPSVPSFGSFAEDQLAA